MAYQSYVDPKLAEKLLSLAKPQKIAQAGNDDDYDPDENLPMAGETESVPNPEDLVSPHTGVSQPADGEQIAESQKAMDQATEPLAQSPAQLPPELMAAPGPQQQLLDLFQRKQDDYSKKAEQAIEQQKTGLADNETYLNKLQGQGQRVNLQPLLDLVDTWTGSNLAKGYQQPQTQEQLQEKLFNLKNLLQQQRSGISDKELALLKDQLAPYKTAQQADIRKGLQDERFAFQAQKNIVEGIKKSPLDGKLITQSNNLVNSLTTASSGTLTSQNFTEVQQAARANMGLKGNTVGEERLGTYLSGLGINGGALEQFLTMKPEDIRKHGGQAFLDHLQDMMQTEISNVQGQRDRLLNKLSGGYGDILDQPQYAAKKQAILDLISSAKAQTSGKPLPRLSKLKEGQMINPNTRQVVPAPYSSKKSQAPMSQDQFIQNYLKAKKEQAL